VASRPQSEQDFEKENEQWTILPQWASEEFWSQSDSVPILSIYVFVWILLVTASVLSSYIYTKLIICTTIIQFPWPSPLTILTLTATPLEKEIVIHPGKMGEELKDDIMSWRETVGHKEWIEVALPNHNFVGFFVFCEQIVFLAFLVVVQVQL
jgi:hypothetical protein